MRAGELLDLDPDFQIDLQVTLDEQSIRLPVESLPKQYIDDIIRVKGGKSRCRLYYGAIENRGGYGSICLAKRATREEVTDICIKIPHNTGYCLCAEAIIQWLAYKSLAEVGIIGAIPRVYDIFQYAGETRFSMEYIEGVSSIDYIVGADEPGLALLQILAQVSLLLAYLEETIRLDHRDLKGDNIWIRPEPVSYSVSIEGRTWTVTAPFQVVILDFGFSCMGAEDGNAIVSLSDGILPKIDPCPKEGRDLFQLIGSIWSVPLVRTHIQANLAADIEQLLSYKGKPYASLITQSMKTRWMYLLVSDSAFRHPPLHPLSLLEMLRIKYQDIGISSG